MKIVNQKVELLWITPQPEKVIEQIGRTCYKSERFITDESAGKFCKNMVMAGHHAMIEHAVASFRFVVDRGVSHEIVRHRLASYAQESTRYVGYHRDVFGGEIKVIEPPGLGDVDRVLWERACEEVEAAYMEMTRSGVKAEIARSVLPTCLATELCMTANFREWRHFIKLRGAKAAHPQIRVIAKLVLGVLKVKAPNVFGDIVEEQ